MRPTERGIVVEGNLTGEEVEMSIDQTAMQHIMGILTDLYSDPEYAVVREYATNAIDAHIEAGNKAPIEVQTPTPLSPFLYIRDHGIGLDVEGIRRIYSQYGASTKRGTDAQTGMLGVGCKAALTYASQFTVTARKNGEMIAVAVGRNDEGGGTMKIVNRMKTSDADGVEIAIPARKGNELQEKATKLFKYWPRGTVLLNGVEPSHFTDESPLKLTDNLWLVEYEAPSRYSYNYQHNTVEHICVMGNVPYPMKLTDELQKQVGIPAHTRLVAYVPIGAVNFTPSREELHYTNHTNATLKKLMDEFKTAVVDAVQREVDNATTHAGALAIVAKWEKYLRKSTDFTYKGDKLPSEWCEYWTDPKEKDGYKKDANGQRMAKPVRVTGNGKGYERLSGYTSMLGLPASSWPTTVWVEDFAPGDCSAEHKRKFMKWAEDEGPGSDVVKHYVLLHGKAPDSPFIDKKWVVSYPDVIRPMKLKVAVPQNQWSKPHIPGSYKVWTEANTNSYEPEKVTGDNLRQNCPIIWQQGSKYSGRRIAEQLAAIFPKFTLVMLEGNRVEKFRRILPKAQTYNEAVASKRDTWYKKLTNDQKIALKIADLGIKDSLTCLDPAKLRDPDLTRAIGLAKVPVDKLLTARRIFGRLADQQDVKWENPLTKYPLYDGRYTWLRHQEHVYTYLNCIYAEGSKTKKA